MCWGGFPSSLSALPALSYQDSNRPRACWTCSFDQKERWKRLELFEAQVPCLERRNLQLGRIALAKRTEKDPSPKCMDLLCIMQSSTLNITLYYSSNFSPSASCESCWETLYRPASLNDRLYSNFSEHARRKFMDEATYDETPQTAAEWDCKVVSWVALSNPFANDI